MRTKNIAIPQIQGLNLPWLVTESRATQTLKKADNMLENMTTYYKNTYQVALNQKKPQYESWKKKYDSIKQMYDHCD
jgi:hypothetical protein